ncbi:MAG: hypothetical protein ABIQ93_00700, partial [Saprospiraceae bacterium]
MMGMLLFFGYLSTWLNNDWKATAVGIVITYLVFIMGIPALIFQTFIPDSLRGVYNEKFKKTWWIFSLQIVLVLILFILSGPGLSGDENSVYDYDYLVAIIFILVAGGILIWGVYYLRGQFESIRDIEQKLSQKIMKEAIEAFNQHRKIHEGLIEQMVILAKELPAGTKRNFFLEECERLLERLVEVQPKHRDTKLIGEILKDVVCLSVTYDRDKFNHENMEKVMAILNLVYHQAYLNGGKEEDGSSYLKTTIANCIKEIAINAMIKNDLPAVMDAIEKLSVIESTHNELYILGSEALRQEHVQTAVTAAQKLKGKVISNIDQRGIQNSSDKRLFTVWLGLMAKIHQLGGSAEEFAQRQIQLVIEHISVGQ